MKGRPNNEPNDTSNFGNWLCSGDYFLGHKYLPEYWKAVEAGHYGPETLYAFEWDEINFVQTETADSSKALLREDGRYEGA